MDEFEREWERRRKESLRASHLRFDRFECGCLHFARRRAVAAVARHWRSAYFGNFAVFNDELTRPNETCDFGIAEFLQQTEDVPVDRLFPEALARPEVTACQYAVNPCVERSSVECDQAAFAIADHSKFRRLRPASGCGGFLFCKPIDRPGDFLHFIADDMPAQFVSLPINPFAVRLIGEASEQRITRPGVLTTDQHRHDYLTAVLRQA